MKTAYTIIEPGRIVGRDADGNNIGGALTCEWVEVEFKGDRPSLQELSRILDPVFAVGPGPRVRDWEHVRVQGRTEEAADSDMFVDDMGKLDGMRQNDAATVVYWTASYMRLLAPKHPGAEYEELFDLVRAAAVAQVRSPQQAAPMIHGRAVLFRDRVWF